MIEELTVEPTHKCNLKCIHCSSRRIKGNLTLDEIAKVIDEYKPKVIRWSGGEPFKYLNIDYLTIGKLDIKHIVTTNGTFVKRTIDLINTIDELRISLYGYSSFHDGVTGVNDSFNKVTELLEKLKKRLMVDDFERKILITSPIWNYKQINDVINIAMSYGLETRITALVPFNEVYDIISGECSLGGKECNYKNKLLLQPDGSLIHCAVEKRGFTCKYKNNEVVKTKMR